MPYYEFLPQVLAELEPDGKRPEFKSKDEEYAYDFFIHIRCKELFREAYGKEPKVKEPAKPAGRTTLGRLWALIHRRLA